MSDKLAFRPRYKFTSDLRKAEIVERVSTNLDNHNPHRIKASVIDYHIVLRMPDDKQHVWSPMMDINLECEQHEKQTIVRCFISPAPNIWTLFMFLYSLLGFIAIVGLMLGLSQMTVGDTPYLFWLVAVGAAGALILYFLAQEGKVLAKDEMVILKHFFDQSLECDCFHLSEQQKAAAEA